MVAYLIIYSASALGVTDLILLKIKNEDVTHEVLGISSTTHPWFNRLMSHRSGR